MIPLHTRAHEWLADRFTFIQYPNVRHSVLASRGVPRSASKPKLSFPARIIVGVLSLFIGMFGLVAIAAALFALYVIVTSL